MLKLPSSELFSMRRCRPESPSITRARPKPTPSSAKNAPREAAFAVAGDVDLAGADAREAVELAARIDGLELAGAAERRSTCWRLVDARTWADGVTNNTSSAER